jgi:hypothetical protein
MPLTLRADAFSSGFGDNAATAAGSIAQLKD